MITMSFFHLAQRVFTSNKQSYIETTCGIYNEGGVLVLILITDSTSRKTAQMSSQNAVAPTLPQAKQPHKEVHQCCDSKVKVKGVLNSQNNFRETGILTDTTLKSTGRTFPCHQVILASASEYFKTMFTSEFKETQSEEVELPSIDPVILETVLDYIYGKEVTLQADNVLRLYLASHLMQVNNLTEITNAFMRTNFKECYEHPSFLDFPLPHLVEYISESHLEVGNDDDVYKAVMRWIKHDLPSREHLMSDLMAHVCLPYCTKSFFCEVILKEPLINKHCQDSLRKAIAFHLVPSSVSTEEAKCIKPRQGSLTVGFEEKSVLKYISMDDGSILSVSEYKKMKYSMKTISDLPYSNCTSSYSLCGSDTTVVISGNKNCSHGPCENRCWSLNTLNGTWFCNPKQASGSQQTYLIFDGTIYTLMTSWSGKLFMLRPHDDDWQTIDSNAPSHITLVDGNSKYLLSRNHLFERFNNKWVPLKKPTQHWCSFRFIDDKLLAFCKGKHQFEYYWYNFTDQTWTFAGLVESQCEGVNEKSKVCKWRGNLVFTYPDGLALFNPNTGILRHFISLKMKDYTKCNIFPIFVPD